MRLLITGANGFLGKYVVKHLSKRLVSADTILIPRSSELDLTSHTSVMSYFDRWRPDTILHLAAMCGGIGFNKKYPADIIQSNLQMAINLFDAVHKYEPEYLYAAGSVCSYPKYCSIPFKEENLWKDEEEETNRGYGFSKKALLRLQEEYRNQYNLKGAHFVIVNMYGPGEDVDLNNSHVIGAFVNKFTDAVRHNKSEVYCWGTGQATREFFYVDDCARALSEAVMTKFDHPEPINLGTGVDISIKELAELVAKLTGFTGKIIFTGEVSDGQPKRKLDVSRAKELLGFGAKISLEEGLKETIKWYKENYDSQEKENI